MFGRMERLGAPSERYFRLYGNQPHHGAMGSLFFLSRTVDFMFGPTSQTPRNTIYQLLTTRKQSATPAIHYIC